MFYFVGDDAMTPENEALRHLPIDLWKDTNDEDIGHDRTPAGRSQIPPLRRRLLLPRAGEDRLSVSADGGEGG